MTFHEVACCPLCGSLQAGSAGEIAVSTYVSCGHRLRARGDPDDKAAVEIRRCAECDLVYKNKVPDPADLSVLYREHGQDAWVSHYDYAKELKLLRDVAGDRKMRILDVGPGQGGFVRAVAPLSSSTSVLDLVEFDACRPHVTGRYVLGMLDGDLGDSGLGRFDVITLFDVLEHLYQPSMAFMNLSRLIEPGGVILAETGNPASKIPVRAGLARWWYLNFVEHHCAWSRRAIEYAAGRFGFDVVTLVSYRHKNRALGISLLGVAQLIKRSVQWFLYRARNVSPLMRFRQGNYAPAPVFEHDHYQVLLRKPR